MVGESQPMMSRLGRSRIVARFSLEIES
jgi:hypothetical protein